MGKEPSWWWTITVAVIVLAFQYVFMTARYDHNAAYFLMAVYGLSLPFILSSLAAHAGYFKAFLFLLIWLLALFYMLTPAHNVEYLVVSVAVSGYAAASAVKNKD